MRSHAPPKIPYDSASLPPARVLRQIRRLNSDRAGVRRSAAHALGRIGDNRAFEALCTALEDADRYVRAEAAEALGKIGDLRGVEVLIPVLTDIAQDDWVRGAAAAALGQIGDVRAVEPLGMAAKEKPFSTHYHATKALIKIGNTQAIALLCEMLQDDNVNNRRGAAELMAHSEKGEVQACEPLCTALQDTDFSVRFYAAQALGWIRDVRAFDGLCAALKDENYNARRTAACFRNLLTTEASSESGFPYPDFSTKITPAGDASEQLYQLSEALFDFKPLADPETWLAQHSPRQH